MMHYMRVPEFGAGEFAEHDIIMRAWDAIRSTLEQQLGGHDASQNQNRMNTIKSAIPAIRQMPHRDPTTAHPLQKILQGVVDLLEHHCHSLLLPIDDLTDHYYMSWEQYKKVAQKNAVLLAVLDEEGNGKGIYQMHVDAWVEKILKPKVDVWISRSIDGVRDDPGFAIEDRMGEMSYTDHIWHYQHLLESLYEPSPSFFMSHLMKQYMTQVREDWVRDNLPAQAFGHLDEARLCKLAARWYRVEMLRIHRYFRFLNTEAILTRIRTIIDPSDQFSLQRFEDPNTFYDFDPKQRLKEWSRDQEEQRFRCGDDTPSNDEYVFTPSSHWAVILKFKRAILLEERQIRKRAVERGVDPRSEEEWRKELGEMKWEIKDIKKRALKYRKEEREERRQNGHDSSGSDEEEII